MQNNSKSNNGIIEEALYLLEEMGWSIIPVGKNKKPLIDWKVFQTTKATSEQVIRWFSDNPNANIAVVTGKLSGIMVVDIDPRHGGTDSAFESIMTVKAKTGGGGVHLYFKYEDGVQNHAGIQEGIDIRGEGGYAVLPPSAHESGCFYEWLVSPHDGSIAPLPEFVKKWMSTDKSHEESEDRKSDEIFNGVTEGKRNESAASVAGTLLKRFPEKEWESQAWPFLKAWNMTNLPPLEESELRQVFESIIKLQSNDGDKKGGGKRSRVLEIVDEIANSKAVLFHDQNKNGHIAINADGSEVFKVSSKPFKQWLAHFIWKEFQFIPSNEVIVKVVQALEGRAIFDGEYHELNVRICEYEGALWYDLGDGCVVKVTKEGWELIDAPPILFRRYPHQAQQVHPLREGTLKELSSFLNLKTEQDQLLFQVYTVSALIPNFPHPLLVLHGPQGAGKTTPLRLLKSLIDPSLLRTLTAPDNIREFIQTANHHQFLFFDNLSNVQEWLSDALARASTGDGFTKRELYTDDEDVIYSFQRSVALNGINLVVQKADLLDRSILLELERIPREQRREEKEFWEDFENKKPYLLGAIFDAMAKALEHYPSILLTSKPRMADFTRWGCAIACSIGYSQQEFLDAYYDNINTQNDEAIEASPVGLAIVAFVDTKKKWEGTATELLRELDVLTGDLKIDTRTQSWPKSASSLSRKAQLIQANLAEKGILYRRDDTARPRKIIIQKIGENAVGSVGPSENTDIAEQHELTLFEEYDDIDDVFKHTNDEKDKE